MYSRVFIQLTVLYLSCSLLPALAKPHPLHQKHKSIHKHLGKKQPTRLYLSSLEPKLKQNRPSQMIQAPPGNRNVIITGTAKNINGQIPNMIQNLTEIKKVFDKSTVILLVDQGDDDGTTQNLQEYTLTHDDTQLLIINNPGKNREDRLTLARNTLLQESQKYFDEYQYYLTLDLDMFQVNAETIRPTLDQSKEWDVATANDPNYYYDRWALRTQTAKIDCWKNRQCHTPLSRWFPHTDLGQKIPTTQAPLMVDSAFGGLGIYKTSHLKQCLLHKDCVYSNIGGTPEQPSNDCEHVHFHQKLQEYTGARITIWPTLTTQHFPSDSPYYHEQ